MVSRASALLGTLTHKNNSFSGVASPKPCAFVQGFSCSHLCYDQRRNSHTRNVMMLHLVCITKYRYPVLREDIQKRYPELIQEHIEHDKKSADRDMEILFLKRTF